MTIRLKRLENILIVCILLFAGGCSGGTSGSGGEVRGVVLDPARNAIPGVEVTLLSQGDEMVTDERGAFAFTDLDEEEPLTLRLVLDGLEGHVDLGPPPGEGNVLQVVLVADPLPPPTGGDPSGEPLMVSVAESSVTPAEE